MTEEADERRGEIKDGEFKKVGRTKEGMNETHQHDTAIPVDVDVSKILQISDLIVFNLFSGRGGAAPSSNHPLYCALEHSLPSFSYCLKCFNLYRPGSQSATLEKT